MVDEELLNQAKLVLYKNLKVSLSLSMAITRALKPHEAMQFQVVNVELQRLIDMLDNHQ